MYPYLEDIGPLNADLALAVRGEVLHRGHVRQLDHVAGEGRPHLQPIRGEDGVT